MSAAHEMRPVVWAGLLAYLAIGLITAGQDVAFHLDPYPIDGTLQVFNPLRRITLGQRAGVDFQVFHGLGLPYLFYPLFRVFGTNLFAAEAVRQLFMPLALVATFLTIFAAFTRSAPRAIRLTALGVLATLGFGLTTLIIPGTSVLGIRTGIALAFIALIATPRRSKLRPVGEGALLGLNALLSTEQGVAIAVAYGTVAAARLVRADRRAALAADAVFVLGIGMATFLIGIAAIAGPSGVGAALRYNFSDVAQDQLWYFGSAPNEFLHTFRQFVEHPVLTLLLMAGLVNAVWWVRQTAREPMRGAPRTRALAVLAVYGVLSTTPLLGMWTVGYVDGLIRVLIITALIVGEFVLARRTLRGRPTPMRGWLPEFVGASLLLLAIVDQPKPMLGVAKAPWHMVSAHAIQGEPPRLSQRWHRTLTLGDSLLRANTGPDSLMPQLWSTYSGPIEASHGIVHPASDYIIHALGRENRDNYIATFRRTRPPLVQTVDPRFSLYEEWLEATTWDLYHELLTHYQVVARGPWSLFWKRKADSTLAQPIAARFDGAQPGSRNVFSVAGIPRDQATVFEAEINYQVENPWGWLPLFGRLPRYVVTTNGAANWLPIPLPPYRTTVRFPIVTAGTDRVSISVEVQSLLPGARINVSSLHLRPIAIDSTTSAWLFAFLGRRSP
jgi:hypothetical protein